MIWISLFLILFFLYVLLIFPTQWLKIEHVSHDLKIGKKILQVSDMHLERNRISPKRLRNVVLEEKPDYIFFTGDFLDTEYALQRLEAYLVMFHASHIPMYAVLGNHDYLLPDIKKITDLLESYNVHVLRNESAQLDGFRLVGIDNYSTGHHKIKPSFRGVKKEDKLVVITHDATVVRELQQKKQKFDYLMAGHFHGKQFNVPYLFHIKNMGPLAKSGVYKGLHTNEYGTLYMSKGVGQTKINARFGIRSEVTIHNL